jgi:hypothetical protein
MNGAEVLAHARRLSPDTSRVLLTGQSDVQLAVAAVNEGAVFRFLCKPCAPDNLRRALHDAVAQYRLVRGERRLLEETLVGSMRLMMDLLELAAPTAFRRAAHARAIVSHVVKTLSLTDGWVFETAATLCQIGCVALPPELLERAIAGGPLSADDQQAFREHPEIAYRLLCKIPRLKPVAEIVRRQHSPAAGQFPNDLRIELGVELLFTALELDRLLTSGTPRAKAVALLRRDKHLVRPELLDAAASFPGFSEQRLIRSVHVRELLPNMTFEDDVRTQSGALLVGRGRLADLVTIERLRRFAATQRIVEPFRVSIDVPK